MQRTDDRLAGGGPNIGQDALQSFTCGSEPAEWVIDGGGPVGASDVILAPPAGLPEPGLMEPEGELLT